MKKSIKAKMLMIFILIFTILATNSIWAIINFNRLNNSIDNIMESNYRTIVAAQNMIVALERQDSAELTQMFTVDGSAEKIFLENEKEFIKWLARAEDNITEIGEADILIIINEMYTQYIKQFNELIRIQTNDGPGAARDYYYNEILPVFESTKEECRNLLNLNQNAMLDRRDRAKAIGKNASYSTILLSIITILIGLILAIYISNKMIKPIYNLIEKIKGITEGDYSQQLDIDSSDEIGELAREFNTMTRKLESYEVLNIKKLMKEKQKAEAIVESISDGIIVTDENNKILLVNRAAEKGLGIREKEVLNRHFLETIKREEIFQMIDEVKNSEDIKSYKKYINITVTTDEKTRHYRINVRPIMDKDGDNVGVVTLMQDITKLKEIDDMKSDFVSTVSHEFRTPLTSISMAAGLLLDKTSGEINENQAELLEAIIEDNERLKNLVSDLLDLSKFESGKVTMDIELQDINEMIEYAVKQFRQRAKDRNISLEIDVKENMPKVNADFNKISWVLTNLVGNALRYTPRDGSGKIVIKAKETANKILVSVADNGKGIAEEYQERIFSKFIQVKDDNGDEKGGTGLGLAISKEIINAHGGEIWVDSKLGDGSIFYFSLYVGT
ncbi:ATP-binding protein [Alkaliphilus peptidifermentans]|uniref:histidine kinase n=1 Tax=Alkaliphilus peptidifermentans DSM 18978 TaxID=1120976 RepID=A0A1G5CKD1_9FIRM|nr:ATP-binding protein [Alkaliphilus peptidifermentans]SCY02767.1 PAS domain S-box-containing protein [Alkaliphilus peptidifermentans DSM 18978]